ncbi:MAG: Gfo/Idh/MocA family oxidoreductase [Enhygromyxa sp.]
MTELRIACIGAGWVAQQVWLPLCEQDPRLEVVALCDPDHEAAARAASRCSSARAFARVDEVLATQPELVIVATPNCFHVPVACELLARGCTVLVEKPVCLTAADVAKLRRATDDGTGRLLMSAAARYRTDILALAELVERGGLGELHRIELRWLRRAGVPRPGSWFTHRTMAGGGVLIDLGWHLLDVACVLAGPLTPGRVEAEISDRMLRDPAAAATWRTDVDQRLNSGDVEDTVRATVDTEQGIELRVHLSWAAGVEFDQTAVELHGSEGSTCLYTTFGYSPLREPEPRIELVQAQSQRRLPFPPNPVGAEYRAQVAALPKLAAEGDPNVWQHIHSISHVVDRIYCAARRGRPEPPLTAARETVESEEETWPASHS